MSFAEVADVTRRLKDLETLPPDELIVEALEEATDQAKFYGSGAWTQVSVPDPVRRIVAAAAARYARNPDGFDQSRAADETVGWADGVSKDYVTFTENEIARVRKFSEPFVAGFGSFAVSAWGNESPADTVYVPWGEDAYSAPFPLIAINDAQGVYTGPWG